MRGAEACEEEVDDLDTHLPFVSQRDPTYVKLNIVAGLPCTG